MICTSTFSTRCCTCHAIILEYDLSIALCIETEDNLIEIYYYWCHFDFDQNLVAAID